MLTLCFTVKLCGLHACFTFQKVCLIKIKQNIYLHLIFKLNAAAMGNTDKRIDADMSKSADFAKPILTHLRVLVHKACPGVEETMKWSMPFFDYKGPMCNMAAFKAHCAFGFWKAALMKDKVLTENAKSEAAMGHLGKIQSLKDLPADKVLLGWIKEAAALNEAGAKLPAKPKKEVAEPITAPPDLAAALKKNKEAAATFEAFTNGNKKEYVHWITEAKTDDTRNKRIATAVEWMAEGKIRNWKYVKKQITGNHSKLANAIQG
jgi:uncharacterized protein YdeI (YjbR/CyaY-like superfamily)